MADPGTRCGKPVKYYELAGRPRPDLFPACWRPRGHPGNKHLSEYAWRKMLERNRHRRKASRELARAA